MPRVVRDTTINGVDVQRMGETVKAIQDNPTLATFQFRAANRWFTGGYNQSTIHGFSTAGQEDTTRTQPFLVEADEPPVLLGKDQSPNPAEYVLHALAACLTTSLVYHAAARGIRINRSSLAWKAISIYAGFSASRTRFDAVSNGFVRILLFRPMRHQTSYEKSRSSRPCTTSFLTLFR